MSDELVQALLWRRNVKEKLRLAEGALADAIEATPKVSLERVQTERGLRAVCDAIGTCESAEGEAERRLASNGAV